MDVGIRIYKAMHAGLELKHLVHSYHRVKVTPIKK